ncbi:MAG: hypothetical protein E6Q51_02490 [Methylophilus methylotrophus]|jgi:hypothetical protein|uniref:Uncharacterized protein n=1 Tax=Methylophilus methylotrophus TaxID=17 RepID=A0A5C7WLI8_METME|nr:hypothetical protein [Methylophilus sp.]PPD11009.1 MAG: hypothetical protein CTY26_11120 [Methylophilus sp.]TXI37812.1 MAG: hypothetical protein E6Q51_02490 [Methylophilus methylotrophus]
MQKTHASTHPSRSSAATTSVLSLIAITAGTVSVALFIMFVGLFLTMMSLGGNSQLTASLHHERPAMTVALVAGSKNMTDHQKTQPRKGYLVDALLRNDGNRHSANSSDRHPQSSSRSARVYAISNTSVSPNQTHLIQI